MRSLLVAIQFYTRIPVVLSGKYHSEDLNKATFWLPLVGLIPGGIMALIFWVTIQFFPLMVSLILAMGAGVLTTGAFHEDGFIDTCDGLGGGWTIEKKLEIMKDSRVGSYGLIGFTLLLFLKISLFGEIPAEIIPLGLLFTALFSRLVPLYLIRLLPYVRADETSKVKPIAKGLSTGALLGANFYSLLLGGGLIFLLGEQDWTLFTPLLTLPPLVSLLIWFYSRQLGGYTGDLLGAAQQIAEVVILGALLLMV